MLCVKGYHTKHRLLKHLKAANDTGWKYWKPLLEPLSPETAKELNAGDLVLTKANLAKGLPAEHAEKPPVQLPGPKLLDDQMDEDGAPIMLVLESTAYNKVNLERAQKPPAAWVHCPFQEKVTYFLHLFAGASAERATSNTTGRRPRRTTSGRSSRSP